MKKIYHVGKNLANVPYSICSALRDSGIPVELYIGAVRNIAEEPPSRESWVHMSHKYTIGNRFQDLIEVSKADYLQTYAGSSTYLQFMAKPFIIYATGSDVHELPYQKTIGGMLMKRSLGKALKVLFSNVHLLEDLKAHRVGGKSVFVPQPVKIWEYGKTRGGFGHERPIFLCPSRIDFSVKGQDIFLKAFSDYKSGGGSGTAVLFDWGPDAEHAKSIWGNSPGVIFLPTCPRKDLLGLYAGSDVVVDQFKLGALGLVSLEGMASGKPVMVYANRTFHKITYGENPPVLNVKNEGEILSALKSVGANADLGKEAKAWVEKYHNPKKVGAAIKAVYEEASWL